MRLCAWAGARRVLLVLVLLAVQEVEANQPRGRHYYIAAVEIDWTYSGNGSGFGSTYKKVVFREYEKDFAQAKTHPSWLGLLGPTLRGEEGETIFVTFRNMATGPHSIHPHGVAYGKQSEGAHYFDNTSQKEKEDDVVQPNSEHVYSWEVTSEVSPQPDDPACLTYAYISHENVVEDYNSGLIGALLICKPGSLDESGKQLGVQQEYVFLFGVFDEKESKHKPSGPAADSHVKYTINGYTQGSLPDVSICAHAPVSLHLLGMSSEPDVFSVHMNGHVLQQNGHRVSSVGLISGSSTTASTKALYTGRWMLSSHTNKHMEAGMHGFVDVKKCDGLEAPGRKMTNEQWKQIREWKYYIAAEEVVWDYAPQIHKHVDEDFKHQYLKQSATRIGPKYKKAVYVLYKNESFTERIEEKQRKNELGILGPVIRAQVRDCVTIVFKNKASRPYSIYPHGLTIEKSEEGVNYTEAGNHSHGVQPGETRTYRWKVVEEDEPLDGDARCLTRMYHSAVDTPRDIASGLIGPMLICRGQSLNVRNVQLKADKEQHAMFAVFDENKSWYLDHNIQQYSNRSRVNKEDPEFYRSNVMHTINGYAFESGPLLGFCNGEVATWHVSSVGAQDYIQTATFYGHPFTLNDRTEDFLSLYPMTGETITMKMDNIGIWLLASLSSHGTTKGMRVKFQDVECYRDLYYEYSSEDDGFSVWNPASLDVIKKQEEQTKQAKLVVEEPDEYTDILANELGLRSRKNQSQVSDAEILDLSLLDYDAIDVPDRSKNTLQFNETINKSTASIRNQNVQTEASFTNWTEVEDVNGVNLTEVSLLNQSLNETMRPVQNSSVEPTFNNQSAYKTENETLDLNWTEPDALNVTVVHSLNHSISENLTQALNISPASTSNGSSTYQKRNETLLSNWTKVEGPDLTADRLANHSISAELTLNSSTVSPTENTWGVLLQNDSGSDADSYPDNVTTSDTNTTALPAMVNVSTEMTDPTLTSVGANLTSTPTVNLPSVTQSGDKQTVDSDSEENVARGDVFSYSVPLEDTVSVFTTPEDHVSVVPLSQREDTHYDNLSAHATNQGSSKLTVDVEEANTSSTGALFGLEMTDSKTSEEDSLGTELEPTDGLQINSSAAEMHSTNSSVQSSEEIGAEGRDNVTVLTDKFNHTLSVKTVSNETVVLGTLPPSSTAVQIGTSQDLSASDSSEEVFIYLKESNTEGIKTTSVKTQDHTWTYEGTHQMVPMDTPDHVKKYSDNETPEKPPPPKKKRVIYRQRPEKGQGMKTKRRKDYSPQASSALAFSPRGFNPGMTPRGSRPIAPKPVSDEEELINTPVVIGVPRYDFSDYDLYVPVSTDLNARDVKQEEYEYVMYKDPYRGHEDIKKLNLDDTAKYYLKHSGPNVKTYFIAAEEVEWDYAGYGQRRQEQSQQASREMTTFTKVVFQGYMDSSFTTPQIRGELEEHLGILGPLITAEVGQSIAVVFRNNAKRPYSLHPNGVSYTKQTEGLSYEDSSGYWYKYDDEVQPNTTFTYLWMATSSVGPTPGESNCRTWAYYSGVNPERDIHSGLIGPLLVCREGTLDRNLTDMREFVLMFMTFDESQSWYYEKNREMIERRKRRRNMNPSVHENLKFHTINGIIYNLKGLRMYTGQLVSWHLINMGSPKDFQSIYFHGQTFLHKKTTSYRQAVYPLLPGSFATLEMYPSKPGLWQLETEVGLNQQNGMQTLFLVLDRDCYRPLGLESGSVKNDQITAINTIGYWEPYLARLNNKGKYNAWSTEVNNSWIQVDFQRPVVISQVATQGAKQMFHSQYLVKYSVSYSTDRRKWVFYKGDSRDLRKVFDGNLGSYDTRKNTFFPPIIGRFVRLHPIQWYNTATVRMEFYGCELDGCSVPLGMESGLIEDYRITASSTASSWYGGPWKSSLARLNRQGTINAWQAKNNDMFKWLQVELPKVMKVTGIITQGAKALGKEMYVTSYSLQYSDNGIHWNYYTDDENVSFKTFFGNTNNSDHVKNYIYPPIFSRFIRIIPRTWMVSSTLRIELLGCDFE